MPLAGGAAISVGEGNSATWGPDGTLIVGGEQGLWSMSISGQNRTQLTTVADGEILGHRVPHVLPNGRAVLFWTFTAASGAQVEVYDFDTGQRTPLLSGALPQFATSGHLVFWRDDSLWAVPFDPDALVVQGDPIPVVEGIATYGLGVDGTLAYTRGGATVNDTLLVWVDREGNEEPVPAPSRSYDSVRLSPDGQQVATQVTEAGNTDVVIYDLGRNTPTRLTFTLGVDYFPAWTIDGSGVVFESIREGQPDLYVKAADGTGDAERLTTTQYPEAPYSFSPDGELLVINAVRAGTNADIGVLSMDGDHTIEWLLETEFREAYPDLSPDGRWIAYESDESGQAEIYVRPFPNVEDGKWPISREGGRGRSVLRRILRKDIRQCRPVFLAMDILMYIEWRCHDWSRYLGLKS